MFKALLYTRIIITVVLIGSILFYLIRWFRQLQKRDSLGKDESLLPISDEIIEQTMQEDINVIADIDEEIIYDEEPIVDIIDEDQNVNMSNTEVTPSEDSENNDEAESNLPQEAPVSVQIQTTTVTQTTTSSYDYTITSDVVEVEIPKDIDASRNIGMGHSRDDIIRDKFDKHIQKIRYETGILKQRNDILGYEKKLVEGITLLPNDIDFQKQLADLYFQQGKYKKAQSLLKKILNDNPQDHNALWQVGEIAVVEGNNEDAYLYLQQAYAICDDNPKYCFSLAQWYYDHDALEQALPLMEKMVKLRPKNIEYLVSLSHVQHKIGDNEGAKQTLLRALELDPMNVTLKNYLKAF